MNAQVQVKKETPIIFQADSIKAILENKKFQTRRLIKPQPTTNNDPWPGEDSCLVWDDILADPEYFIACGHCPYGKPGDSLWVKENYAVNGWAAKLPVKEMDGAFTDNIVYKASEPHTVYHDWKSSIFMPEWASRIRFTLTGIRIERVSDISREDAFKEGVEAFHPAMHYYCDEGTDLDPTPSHRCYPVGVYRKIWNKLHAKVRRVKKNPYTGEKEDCYVACPFDAEDREEGAEEYRGKMLYWIPSPWVWVLEWEEVIVRRKK